MFLFLFFFVDSDRLLFIIGCFKFLYLNSLLYLRDDFSFLLSLLLGIYHLSIIVASILLLDLIFIILESKLDELLFDFFF